MDMKLFASTFALIFLAELGDKTQLAALAQSVNGRWTVFLAASSALVLSTLIAVLVGDGLGRFVPPAHLKLGAGILFVLIGLLMLKSAIWGEVKAVEAAPPASILASVAIKAAEALEEAAAADYRALAAQSAHSPMRTLFAALAEEEQSHLDRLQTLLSAHDILAAMGDKICPALRHLIHDVAADVPAKPEVIALLNHATAHEEAMARFYRSLSQDAALPSLRAAFAMLATEEDRHAARLRETTAKLEPGT